MIKTSAYAFSVTSYAGHEEEILRVRIRNRPAAQLREYLYWLYLAETTETPPIVFWMRDSEERCVGMASLIFRPYMVDNKRCYFGVLGDISINEEHRGEGLSAQLFQFMNSHIAQNNISIAFVMPNKAAAHALQSSGWQTVGNLVPRVCVLRPVPKVKSRFKLGPLANLVSAGLRAATRMMISRQIPGNIRLELVADFDSEFQEFWDGYPKSGMILHDRSVPSMRWRYLRQPGKRSTIGKFYQDNRLVGFIVGSVSEENGMFLIGDFLVADPGLISPCMALFLQEALNRPEIITVRIVLIEESSYARPLWKLSFLRRQPVTVFQIFHASGAAMTSPHSWFITAGDKDA